MIKSSTTLKHENTVEKQLNEIQRLACNLTRQVAEARSFFTKQAESVDKPYYGDFNEMVIDMAYGTERLTEKARRMVLEVTVDDGKYERYTNELVKAHNIKITYSDGIFSLSIPFLIPHRKCKHTDYLYKPLYTALRNWYRARGEGMEEVPYFETCTVAFLHVYDENLPLERVRDHDNIEEKHVIDVLCNFVIRSDNGLNLNTYHETELGAEDRTHVTVIESKNFVNWLQNG